MTLNQHKIENYVIITSWKSETMGKLINRIPGLRLLISNLPGSALRQASRCQQAFSKPCLVNFKSKDKERLFLAVPWDCLRLVIAVFPDHTHLLFFVLT